MTERELICFGCLLGVLSLFAAAVWLVAWLGKAEGKEP